MADKKDVKSPFMAPAEEVVFVDDKDVKSADVAAKPVAQSADERIIDLVTKSMMAMMPAMMTLMTKAQGQSFDVAEARKQAARDLGPRCGECGQHAKTAHTDADHEWLCLYPRTNLGIEHHQGVFINGVKYYCEYPGQKVCLPKGSAALKMLENDESMINEQVNGRKIQRNSGFISQGSTLTNPGSGFAVAYPGFAGRN